MPGPDDGAEERLASQDFVKIRKISTGGHIDREAQLGSFFGCHRIEGSIETGIPFCSDEHLEFGPSQRLKGNRCGIFPWVVCVDLGDVR